VLACSWCVIAEKQDEQMRALAVAPRTDAGADDDFLDALGGSLAASEKEIAKLKGDIAARLGVSVDYVDVVVEDEDGVLSISFAMVLIPAGDIPAFLARSDSPAS
jgi:hypothetical protein